MKRTVRDGKCSCGATKWTAAGQLGLTDQFPALNGYSGSEGIARARRRIENDRAIADFSDPCRTCPTDCARESHITTVHSSQVEPTAGKEQVTSEGLGPGVQSTQSLRAARRSIFKVAAQRAQPRGKHLGEDIAAEGHVVGGSTEGVVVPCDDVAIADVSGAGIGVVTLQP